MARGARPTPFAQYKGKVVVYNIGAEWCGPCVEEMPTLVKLQEAFAGKDVVVVLSGCRLSRSARLRPEALHQAHGRRLPFRTMTKFDVNADAKSGAFPTTIIYGKGDGMEAARLLYPAK